MDQDQERPDEAESVAKLCELVLENSQDQKRLEETLGTLGLLFGVITRQGQPETLRAACREIAQYCSVPQTKKILRIAKIGLTELQIEWLNSQLHAIAQGSTPLTES